MSINLFEDDSCRWTEATEIAEYPILEHNINCNWNGGYKHVGKYMVLMDAIIVENCFKESDPSVGRMVADQKIGDEQHTKCLQEPGKNKEWG